jgi:hypothetical protein
VVKLLFILIILFRNYLVFSQDKKPVIFGNPAKVHYGITYTKKGLDTTILCIVSYDFNKIQKKKLICNLTSISYHDSTYRYLVSSDSKYDYSDLYIRAGIQDTIKAYIKSKVKPCYLLLSNNQLQLQQLKFDYSNSRKMYLIYNPPGYIFRATGMTKNNIPIYQKVLLNQEFKTSPNLLPLDTMEKLYQRNLNLFLKSTRSSFQSQNYHHYFQLLKVVGSYRIDYFDMDYYPTVRFKTDLELKNWYHKERTNDSLIYAIRLLINPNTTNYAPSMNEIKFLYEKLKTTQSVVTFKKDKNSLFYIFSINGYAANKELAFQKNGLDTNFISSQLPLLIRGRISRDGIIDEYSKTDREPCFNCRIK